MTDDEELLPCPNCGRLPKAKTAWMYTSPYSLFGVYFECRKWLGLRRCFTAKSRESETGHHWNEKDWADLARRRARRTWNVAVGLTAALRP